MSFDQTTKDGQKIIWQPQPGPQTALIECPVFEIFYGGARGGGKTESSIGDWLQHSGQYGEHAIGIFVRRKLTQLSEVIARTKALFPKIGAMYNEQSKTWTMPGGGRLRFVYLERDSDAEEYQGHSYTRVYIEEVPNFPTPGPIDKLRATLRSGAGVPVGMRLTGNPGGPGHNWVKLRYIDPDPKGYRVITEQTTFDNPETGEPMTVALSRVFIPSKLGDNALLIRNDPTYVLRLRKAGSEALVKAWLNGDWNLVDGAFFDEWDENIHVLETGKFSELLLPSTMRFRSFDWGSAKPFSVGWWAMFDRDTLYGDTYIPRGAMVRYREWYGAKAPNVGLKMTADLVAKGIVERERGEIVRYGTADPSIFIRNGGPSIAETMAVNRCQWGRGDNKRQAGWEQLRQRLSGVNGRPMLFFCDNCVDSIRTLPVLQHDETNPEDLDTDAEDHAADDIRYGCMSRPWLPMAKEQQTGNLPKSPQDYTINELLDLVKKRRLAEQE